MILCFQLDSKKGEYKDKINKSIRRKIITKRGKKNHHNSMYNSCFLRKVKEREKKPCRISNDLSLLLSLFPFFPPSFILYQTPFIFLSFIHHFLNTSLPPLILPFLPSLTSYPSFLHLLPFPPFSPGHNFTCDDSYR